MQVLPKKSSPELSCHSCKAEGVRWEISTVIWGIFGGARLTDRTDRGTQNYRTPPPTWQRSQNPSPARKVKKESRWRLVFDSFWGVTQDPRRLRQRLSRRLFFDFSSRGGGGVLTPLQGRGGRNTQNYRIDSGSNYLPQRTAGQGPFSRNN